MDNIDIEWFFKVPGLFITGGVFLILIAIIVYIVGNSKAKKASQDDTNYTVDVDSVKDNTTNSNVVAPLVNPTVNTVSVESSTNNSVNTIGGQPVNVVESEKKEAVSNGTAVSSFEPLVTPVVPEAKSTITPIVTPIEPVSVTPATPVTSVVEENKTEVATPVVSGVNSTVTPIVTPIEPVSVTPVTPVTPAVEENKVEVATPAVPEVNSTVTPIVTPIEPVSVTPVTPVTPVVEESKVEIATPAVPEVNSTVTPIVTPIEPVVENQMADEAKAVTVDVAPPTEVQVQVSGDTTKTEVNNTDVNAGIKIEPIVDTPAENKETPVMEVKPQVSVEEVIEEI